MVQLNKRFAIISGGDEPQPEEAPCCPPRKPSLEVQ